MIHTLDTARLLLRPWDEAYAAPFAALNADPEVMRHFPACLTRAESDAVIARFRAHFAEHGWGNWAVLRREDQAFLGFVGLSIPRFTLPFSPCVEVGWRLIRAAWGQGYASEAARASLAFGFDTLGLQEIVSFTALENQRSRAVMERIGMRNSGRDFDHPALSPGHRLQRHCLYTITRPEPT
ncbi:GNAT family N-acetyltransferase [Massilia sp. TS11]|uniref:GNAT family N-acetyltransferase n=1 Tax=Massilia sp. TS11 TaxID=2908003 RepID=UPI001EDA6AAC|nr:GNAT family N-acetyltransferase [Massilia sp. TS11]MCG2584283.1 GNAT family N-acetyltransferase [Massilia sp. TS11]